MPVQQELCRNFQRGSCQFGQRCKFLHVNPQQQRPNNLFGAGAQSVSFQPQKSNPYGFGVQNNSQQKPFNKPFENTWTRFSPVSTGTAPASRQSESQAQANHNAPCDIVGDISYEELRAAAYDDAKRGLSFQSIVDREWNLLSSKLREFENLCKPHAVRPSLTPANQNTFPGMGPNAFSQPAQNSAPTSVSTFSQLGASLNVASGPRHLFFLRPPAPSNNAFLAPSPFGVSSQTPSAFGTKSLSSEIQGTYSKVFSGGVFPFEFSSCHIPVSSGDQFPAPTAASPFTSSPSVFGNNSFVRAESNPVIPSAVPAQNPGATNNPSPGLFMGLNPNSNANGEVQQTNYTQNAELSGVDTSVWLRTKWSPGEIPDEAPPDAVCS
ncbi:Zinc finger CCCH domain-containing protein 16 [Morus notabilis]|uniref:Zinc finger CCCH domain-containing protein 16 n=1 Tax=Morus notabilis TaxID=981085 RepID=W9RF24_9ROSA|nr:Zinc finger CCCH domain-containing protein 16 [Morus notabilis]